MADAAQVVGRFQQAMGGGDFAAARSLLHDDFTFIGPFDRFDAPEPYLDALKKLQPVVRSIVVKRMFVDGSDVCVLYDMVTNTSVGTAFIAEWFQVRGGRIAAITAVFDARPWVAMFGDRHAAPAPR